MLDLTPCFVGLGKDNCTWDNEYLSFGIRCVLYKRFDDILSVMISYQIRRNQIKSILLPYELQVSHFTDKHTAVYNMRLKQHSHRKHKFVKPRERKTQLGLWAPKLIHISLIICIETKWRTCHKDLLMVNLQETAHYMNQIRTDLLCFSGKKYP